MTQTPLRLVFDRGAPSTRPQTIDVPSTTTTLHIHLHLGSEVAQQAPVAVAHGRPGQESGRSGRRLAWSLLLGVAGVAIVVGAYDFGARIGEGHAREVLATYQAGPAGPSRLALETVQPRAALPSPNELPSSIRQQLTQLPTITAPPGMVHPPGTPDPFGLQR